MKRYLATLFFVGPMIGFSNIDDNITPIENILPFMSIEIDQEGVDPEKCENGSDDNGWKQGYWCIWGNMKPDKGYPEDGKIEEGPYVDDRKTGEWIKYHVDGKTPRLIGNFENNRPNGKYTKYYPTGGIMEEGTFSGGKLKEVYKRYHENGIVAQEKTFNEEGKEEGVVSFFFEDGTPEFVFTKKNGVTVGTATRYYPNGDVKELITYNDDGSVAKKEPKERVNPPKGEEDVAGGGGPGIEGGDTKGVKFEPSGYNKVYNADDELWLDGKFKNGKLWDGKLYKYDSDGILLKIEIWKEGKYHSDGQLK